MSMTFKQPKKHATTPTAPSTAPSQLEAAYSKASSTQQRWTKPLSLTENSCNSPQNSYVTNADTDTSHHTILHA